MRTLGVLLAGGRGRRMGGTTPKALRECGGRTLLKRALDTLAAVTEEVVVVAPGAMPLPVSAASRVADPPGAAGPLAALVAGLGSRPFDEALVLAVDLPLLTSGTLGALRALRGGSAAVLATPGGRPQPLAAWYAASALAPLVRSLESGERAATAAALSLAPRLVDDAELAGLPGGIEAWWNVNTPEDLAFAGARLSDGWRP